MRAKGSGKSNIELAARVSQRLDKLGVAVDLLSLHNPVARAARALAGRS